MLIQLNLITLTFVALNLGSAAWATESCGKLLTSLDSTKIEAEMTADLDRAGEFALRATELRYGQAFALHDEESFTPVFKNGILEKALGSQLRLLGYQTNHDIETFLAQYAKRTSSERASFVSRLMREITSIVGIFPEGFENSENIKMIKSRAEALQLDQDKYTKLMSALTKTELTSKLIFQIAIDQTLKEDDPAFVARIAQENSIAARVRRFFRGAPLEAPTPEEEQVSTGVVIRNVPMPPVRAPRSTEPEATSFPNDVDPLVKIFFKTGAVAHAVAESLKLNADELGDEREVALQKVTETSPTELAYFVDTVISQLRIMVKPENHKYFSERAHKEGRSLLIEEDFIKMGVILGRKEAAVEALKNVIIRALQTRATRLFSDVLEIPDYQLSAPFSPVEKYAPDPRRTFYHLFARVLEQLRRNGSFEMKRGEVVGYTVKESADRAHSYFALVVPDDFTAEAFIFFPLVSKHLDFKRPVYGSSRDYKFLKEHLGATLTFTDGTTFTLRKLSHDR